MMENVTVVIPSHNTLHHLKNTYVSIRKHYPTLPLIIVDDASSDGTGEWLGSLTDTHLISISDPIRKGHTFWYDEGMRMSKTDIVAILHSDMIIGPNYFENLLKHLKPKTVVCATRVEPPIHPPGQEKIVQNFGMDYSDIRWEEFEKFCVKVQEEHPNKTTRGIFAPWVLYKEDHLRIGGHDQNFAPYGYEDSDIFNRWILAGYDMIQSRDSLVYHLTCRGHRWNKGVGIENPDYKNTMQRGQRYFLRKWNQWIQNDEYMMPIIQPKYDTCLILKNIHDMNLLGQIEPWVPHVCVDNSSLLDTYIQVEQPNSKIDLKNKISLIQDEPEELTNSDVYIILDCNTFTGEDMQNITRINLILQELDNSTKDEYECAGQYQIGNLLVKVNKLKNTIGDLVSV